MDSEQVQSSSGQSSRRPAGLVPKEKTRLRAVKPKNGRFKAGEKIGEKLKYPQDVDVDKPEVIDTTGEFIRANVNNRTGFIRGNKVSYRNTPQQSETDFVPLFHIYLSQAHKEHALAQKTNTDLQEMMELRKRAAEAQERDLEDYNTLKNSLQTPDPKIRFNDDSLRIDVAYTYQQITELYPAFKHYTKSIESKLITTPTESRADDFEKAFGEKSQMQKIRLERQRVSDKAEADMENFKYSEYDTKFTADKINQMRSDLQSMNQTEAIKSLLQTENNEGFILGEEHSDSPTKKLLLDNINQLKNSGVTTFYIEGFRSSEYQDLINNYLKSNDDSMPSTLSKFVDLSDDRFNLKDKHPHNLRGILEMAKRNTIRIVAIDDDTARPSQDHDRQGNRARARTMKLNYIAKEIILKDNQRIDKYIALIGESHSHTHEGLRCGIPGLSQQLNIPAVKIANKDSRLELHEEDKSNRTRSASD